MRRFFLLVAMIFLFGGLCVVWAYRFHRTPGLPTWTLADLRTSTPDIPGIEWTGPVDRPSLRAKVDRGNPRVAARIVIAGMPAVERLHLKFRLSARSLIPGAEEWEDGRIMVEWHSPDGKSVLETESVGSIRLNDQRGPEDFVLERSGPAIPTLRIEHLGRGGEFKLSDLEIRVVDERMVWKIGRWMLLAGWICWVAVFLRMWPEIRWSRAILTAFVWSLMGINLAIPGPWKNQRPLVVPFQLGGAHGPVSIGNATGPLVSQAIPALGKMPDQGSLILRIKLQIKKARPLLHALLLFGPTLLVASLVGRKPALYLMIFLALMIELAQLAFGFGLDWVDVMDLTCDAIGIGLALWLVGYLMARARPLRRV